MARMIRSGLIQMSLPKTEGEGTIPEIINAMVQKHRILYGDRHCSTTVAEHGGVVSV